MDIMDYFGEGILNLSADWTWYVLTYILKEREIFRIFFKNYNFPFYF